MVALKNVFCLLILGMWSAAMALPAGGKRPCRTKALINQADEGKTEWI
jgi:hypothetical protein